MRQTAHIAERARQFTEGGGGWEGRLGGGGKGVVHRAGVARDATCTRDESRSELTTTAACLEHRLDVCAPHDRQAHGLFFVRRGEPFSLPSFFLLRLQPSNEGQSTTSPRAQATRQAARRWSGARRGMHKRRRGAGIDQRAPGRKRGGGEWIRQWEKGCPHTGHTLAGAAEAERTVHLPRHVVPGGRNAPRFRLLCRGSSERRQGNHHAVMWTADHCSDTVRLPLPPLWNLSFTLRRIPPAKLIRPGTRRTWLP